MPGIGRSLRVGTVLAAGALALAALAGCTTGGQPDDTATSKRDPAFPRFTTLPDVPVVHDLVYGRTDDGSRLLADVCLPPTGPDEQDGQKPRDAATSRDDARGGDASDDSAPSGGGDADATASPTPSPTPSAGDDGAAPPEGTAGQQPTGSATGDATAEPDSTGATGAADAGDVPDDATPGILMVHGGGWVHGDKATLAYRATCQWLAKSTGFPVVTIDYRLAPQHPFPAAFEDVQAAVRWMRQPEQVERFHIDPERIGAFGGSAGANLVSLLGATGKGDRGTGTRVAAVVELSGPVDLTGVDIYQRFIPTQESYTGCADLETCQAAHDGSPRFFLDRTDPPFFVGHAVHDPVIPYAQSTDFVKQLRAKGIETVFVKTVGGAHSIAQLPGNDRLQARIVDFLTTHLGPRA